MAIKNPAPDSRDWVEPVGSSNLFTGNTNVPTLGDVHCGHALQSRLVAGRARAADTQPRAVDISQVPGRKEPGVAVVADKTSA